MKRAGLLVLIFAYATYTGVGQEKDFKSDNKDYRPEIKFESTIHDLGKIKYNGDGAFSFKFENKGKEPLLVKDVSSSCGCIIPSWTKEPVKSGETGLIKVECNTRIVGNFSSTVRVYSNAKNRLVSLLIKGQVGEKE